MAIQSTIDLDGEDKAKPGHGDVVSVSGAIMARAELDHEITGLRSDQEFDTQIYETVRQ